MKPEMVIYDERELNCRLLHGMDFFMGIGEAFPNMRQERMIPLLETNGYKLFMITHIEDGVNRWYWKLEAQK